ILSGIGLVRICVVWAVVLVIRNAVTVDIIVTSVPETVSIRVRLFWVLDQRTCVAGIRDPIVIGVEIAGIAKPVTVDILLVGIRYELAVVLLVFDSIAINV